MGSDYQAGTEKLITWHHQYINKSKVITKRIRAAFTHDTRSELS